VTQLISVFHFLATAAIGHFVGALVLYLNHRFVFHGRLGKLPALKKMRRLHTLHHRHAFDDLANDYLVTPLWGQLSLSALFILSGIIVSPAFALGLFTFALVYAYRHRITHNGDQSRFALHHMHHHRKIDVNFAGVYPIFDRAFFTYESSK
jgi:sterol desaturase/sphingolipid hydroxylase (fatty acid hydroxylase superfamily)